VLRCTAHRVQCSDSTFTLFILFFLFLFFCGVRARERRREREGEDARKRESERGRGLSREGRRRGCAGLVVEEGELPKGVACRVGLHRLVTCNSRLSLGFSLGFSLAFSLAFNLGLVEYLGFSVRV